MILLGAFFYYLIISVTYLFSREKKITEILNFTCYKCTLKNILLNLILLNLIGKV